MEYKQNIIKELEDYLIPGDSIDSITQKFKNELYERLMESSNSMLPSMPSSNPRNPNKNDHVLAIDFGGTNLKFAIFETYPSYVVRTMDTVELENKLVDLEFFDAIVTLILDRLNDKLFSFFNIDSDDGNHKKTIQVSITFSFPLDCDNHITAMGKDFILTNEVKNLSIIKILQSAFNRICKWNHLDKYFNFQINDTIINDSVAVHLTNNFINCSNNSNEEGKNISLILGTGINSSFELPYSILPKFKRNIKMHGDETVQNVLINSEIGFLGKDIIKSTPFDVFEDSKMPMPLENITSGKYLPAILKNVLNYYKLYPELTINFNGEMLVNIVDNRDIGVILSDFDIDFVRQIAKLIMKRGSIYTVAAILAINSLVDENSGSRVKRSESIKVGYVGSFLAYSEFYQNNINQYSNSVIDLQYLQDSSLFGAAIATSI